jgi:hypothetical protein
MGFTIDLLSYFQSGLPTKGARTDTSDAVVSVRDYPYFPLTCLNEKEDEISQVTTTAIKKADSLPVVGSHERLYTA